MPTLDEPTREQLKRDIREYVAGELPEYHSYMPKSFFDAMRLDVIETSALMDEGIYSEGDISLAYQRTIASKFGVAI